MMRLLLLALLFAPAMAAAQSGTVQYSVTTKIDVRLPPGMEHMRDQIPTEQTREKELIFNAAAVLTRDAPKEEEEAVELPDSDGGRIFFSMGGRDADEQTFVDLEAGTSIETQDFFGRMFRIVGEPERLAWRLTGEQGVFLGHPVQQAFAERDSTTLQAWFTTSIPVSAGPETYGGLPGLILVLTDGRRTYEATRVTLGEIPADALAPPTDGREVTRERFDEIVEQKMEEMRESRPRGRRGGFRIVTNE